MKKIIPFISLVIMSLSLTGCFLRVHKMDVIQGNILTKEEMAKLRIGMTEAEVRKIMGNPVTTTIFSDERLDYIYSFQPGYRDPTYVRLICVFNHGRLEKILRD